MSRTFIVGFLGAALLAACGSAQVINRTPQGGTMQLNGDRNKAYEDAHRQMAAHCGPGNYQIVREGYDVVGTDTVARADTYDQPDGTTTTAGQSTREATEWRLSYTCGGAAPPPGPAPGPAPGPEPAPDPGGPPPPPGY